MLTNRLIYGVVYDCIWRNIYLINSTTGMNHLKITLSQLYYHKTNDLNIMPGKMGRVGKYPFTFYYRAMQSCVSKYIHRTTSLCGQLRGKQHCWVEFITGVASCHIHRATQSREDRGSLLITLLDCILL